MDYRGALQGKGAHTVWVGDVLIRKVAEGITTYESNRNLVLTDGCRADSVPNLEIETGEIVGAGHASTTGRFDDEQLFYLRSRGITEAEARRLVVHGFFADIIRRIGVPAIEDAAAGGRRGRARDHGAECRRELSVPHVCATDDVKPRVGDPGPEVDGVEVAMVNTGGDVLRHRRRVRARRGSAVRGRVGRRRDRVLPARLPVRPAHRGAARAARHRARAVYPVPGFAATTSSSTSRQPASNSRNA